MGYYGQELQDTITIMDFKIKIKEKIYDISIAECPNGSVDIKVGDKSFSFAPSGTSGGRTPTVSEFGQSQKVIMSKELKASLGGIVSEIFVKVGDKVGSGQKILTLLAMKMENEILAESEGVVKDIKVSPDQAVKEGEILITFE